jgi:hypothetical protein
MGHSSPSMHRHNYDLSPGILVFILLFFKIIIIIIIIIVIIIIIIIKGYRYQNNPICTNLWSNWKACKLL